MPQQQQQQQQRPVNQCSIKVHAQAGVAVKVHFGIMYDHVNACNVVFFNSAKLPLSR